MTYKDQTFCASNVKTHTCGRELTEEDQKKEYITMGKFCEEPTPESPCCSAGIVDGRCADCKELVD